MPLYSRYNKAQMKRTTCDGLAGMIVESVRSVIPADVSEAALHEPDLSGREREYLDQCLDSGWVSSAGAYVDEFESALCSRVDRSFAIATVNGTAALHVALMTEGIGPGDEVLMPALTFVATANAVAYTGATPHFVDIDHRTFGIDPERLEEYLASITRIHGGQVFNRRTGRRLRAIVPVHVFGHPVEMDPLNSVAANYGIPVIEDAAEALGSMYRGVPAGSCGKMAVFSFNGNKIVTTGGGGAVLTDDENIASHLRHLTTTAKTVNRWTSEHDRVGYNYRMPNLNAALGCAQLQRLDDFIERKRHLADRYRRALKEVAGVGFFVEQPHVRSNYWLNVLLLDREYSSLRDQILEAMADAGFACRALWTPMHRLPMFSDCPRMELNVTEDLVARAINLPSSPSLAAT